MADLLNNYGELPESLMSAVTIVGASGCSTDCHADTSDCSTDTCPSDCVDCSDCTDCTDCRTDCNDCSDSPTYYTCTKNLKFYAYDGSTLIYSDVEYEDGLMGGSIFTPSAASHMPDYDDEEYTLVSIMYGSQDVTTDSMNCPWKDFSLTYKFQSNDPTKYATLTFNKNGGSGSAPSITKATTGAYASFTIPDYELTKDGYVLSGWSYNGTTYSIGQTVSFYASYTGETYTLTAVWSEAGNTWIYHNNLWRKGIMWIYSGGWKRTKARIYSNGWK